jgi:UDP-glucuronate 4-epimerase
MSERFVVTGAHGCVGAWVLAELVREKVEVVAVDVAPGVGRASLVLNEAKLARIRFVEADISDPTAVGLALRGATHVVHLAALQYPYCRDDHVAGARVNVLGTLNVFDAAFAAGARLVYASSIAALAEGTLYGTWKRANEGTAAAFWAEDGFPSVGVRAALVYGVGRDRGVTASMTLAMQAAAENRPFHIAHGGTSPLNHAGDLARVFVRAARAVSEGAPVYDAGGREHGMGEVVAAIHAAAPAARVSFEDRPFAVTPPGFDGRALEDAIGEVEWRPLDRGVAETVELYRELARE